MALSRDERFELEALAIKAAVGCTLERREAATNMLLGRLRELEDSPQAERQRAAAARAAAGAMA